MCVPMDNAPNIILTELVSSWNTRNILRRIFFFIDVYYTLDKYVYSKNLTSISTRFNHNQHSTQR